MPDPPIPIVLSLEIILEMWKWTLALSLKYIIDELGRNFMIPDSWNYYHPIVPPAFDKLQFPKILTHTVKNRSSVSSCQ